MIEENETVHQIEVEIERLMKIISDDRKLIQEKDLQITKLRDNERTKLFQEELDDEELMEVKLKLLDSQAEIESLKIDLKTQMDLSSTHTLLQSKMSELMKIIEQQNAQIKSLSEKEKSQEIIYQRNETLQKELHVLKIMVQQKDLDIKSLNQLLEEKEQERRENEGSFKAIDSEANSKIKEKDDVIKVLEKRMLEEQDSHKETEDELIKLKIELETVKNMNTTISNSSEKEKDEIILNLQTRFLQEQQIASHVQFVQEKEILEKEGCQIRSISKKDLLFDIWYSITINYLRLFLLDGQHQEKEIALLKETISRNVIEGNREEVKTSRIIYHEFEGIVVSDEVRFIGG